MNYPLSKFHNHVLVLFFVKTFYPIYGYNAHNNFLNYIVHESKILITHDYNQDIWQLTFYPHSILSLNKALTMS